MSDALNYSTRKLKRKYFRAVKQAWYAKQYEMSYNERTWKEWATSVKRELERRGVWLP